MEEILKRKEGESDTQYIKRLVYSKLVDKTLDIDYAELSTLIFGQELSSCECRKRCYGLLYLFQVMDKEKINDIDDENEDILREIENKTLELNLERKKLQSQRVEINRWVREKSRIELYLEYMKDSIEKLEEMKIPRHIEIKDDKKAMLLNVADTHIGKKGVVKGLKGEILNEYNYDIFEKRMWQLFDETVHIIKKENIHNLYFLVEGDLIDGILRQSQLQSLQYGVIDSVIKTSEFFSNYINELSKYVNIQYYSAYGNHDSLRLLNAKSSGDFPNENVGRLIDFYIKERLKNNTNVVINDNDLPYSFFNVLGRNIMISHGENKNIAQTIKDYMAMYNERIDMLITGHMHSKQVQGIGIGENGDIEIIRVPSICGIDDFSQKIRKFSNAGSTIIILEEGKKSKITYDIVLD